MAIMALFFPQILLGSDFGWVHFYEGSIDSGDHAQAQQSFVDAGELITWWGELEPQEGVYDFSKIDSELSKWKDAGKKLDIRLATAHNHPLISPQWLFDQYHVRRIARGLWHDFEADSINFTIGKSAQITDEPLWVISGKHSLLIKPSAANQNIQLEPSQLNPLQANSEYAFELDYRTEQDTSIFFEVVSSNKKVLDTHELKLTRGNKMSHSLRFRTVDQSGLTWRMIASPSSILAIDNVNLIYLTKKITVHKFPFDQPEESHWLLENGVKLKNRSIVIHGSAEGSGPQITNHLERLPLRMGEGYAFSFRYRADEQLKVHCQLVSLTEPTLVVSEKTYQLKAGASGEEHFYHGSYLNDGSYQFKLHVIGDGQLELDQLSWIRWSDRVTCFPDYFNPLFFKKWARMVVEFSNKFKDHPALGTVSVGGFGRWEEVILDDDGYGALDSQWLARGYTQELYLKHISQCMDLYRQQFREHPLRICLAYGLLRQTNSDWIYRRVAQAAVARGIGLKQNGWSEKWDMWDSNTNASYLWNRYRHHPNISLTLETGGHISKGGHGGGHPISFLNRGLIDGTNIMFFYASDLVQPHLTQFSTWCEAQLSGPNLSNFYCRLADLGQHYDGSSKQVPHRNAWLGLRLVHPESEPLHYGSDGRYAYLETSRTMPTLAFDLDDRQQYNGLSGESLSLEYFDSGNDTFKIHIWQNDQNSLRNVATVQKNNSNQWKTAEIYLPGHFPSERNGGANIENDIVLDSANDGHEKFSHVQLQAVPMREWRTEKIHHHAATAQFTPLESTLTHVIPLGPNERLDRLEIPLHVSDLTSNALTARVYALTHHGEVMICHKDYLLPAEGDLFPLPLNFVEGTTQLRIELSHVKGAVAWYLSENGKPAWNGYRWQSERVEAPLLNGNWAIERAFSAIEIHLGKSFNGSSRVRLQKIPHHTGAPMVVAESNVSFTHGMATLAVSAHGAGNYRILCEELPPGSIKSIFYHSLIPLDEPRPTKEIQGKPLSTSITRVIALQPVLSATQSTTYRLEGAGSAIELSLDRLHLTNSQDTLVIPWKNATCAGLARILWADENQPFHESRACWIPLVQNDSHLRHTTIAVGLHPLWQKSIKKIRIEPATGNTGVGTIQIGPLNISH